ncbi:MAG: hypothetical protein PHF86_04100 [Candidatus Nanoarchaeia archaeon]|nr:hypothetical protein [Candidatus Nanoarchaeia archaeon]
MADKRKYVSQFEIQSNIDEALKKLQKYFVEMSKLPGTVEDFNKSLKKNTVLEKQYFEMMSAIPKTMQKLSTLAKIELFPRKEMERLSNAVQLIESASKSISGFDSGEISNLVKEFGNVVSELDAMENRHDTILDRSKAYNNLLAEASSIEKKLVADKDKMKNSTLELSKSWTKIKGDLTRVTNQLKSAPKDGTLSVPFMTKTADKIEEIRQTVQKMNDDYKKIDDTTRGVAKNFDEILRSSNEISGSLGTAARTSFEETVSQIEDLRDQFEIISENTEKDNSTMLSQLDDIKTRLDERSTRLNEILGLENKLVAETKTENDAVNLMNRVMGEILEEQGDMQNWNKAISSMFNRQAQQVMKIRSELEKLVLDEQASNEEIRAKMGLLKLEGDKLRMIANRQEEIKRLESESISMTVRRAKEQNEINKAYIRQTLQQRKNLGGLVDAFKVFKKGIPTKAVATFGETGVVAAKGMGAAFKLLGAVLAPLAGLFTFVGVLQTIMTVEKQIKTARKQVLAMAANTNTAGRAFDDVRKGTKELADSNIEHMRKQTEKWAWSLGISMDQAIGYLNDFSKAGFRLTSSLRNLEDFMGIATTLGMEITEVASSAGNLRAEFGMSLSEIGTSFVQMQKDAAKAGITTSIFFDKVLNAGTGLGLYGRRIDEVSSLFSGLVKNMKLPEAAATSAAGKIIKSFKDLDAASQITIYRMGKGNEIWAKFYEKRIRDADSRIKRLRDEEASLETQTKGMKEGADKDAKVEELNEKRKQRDLLESQKRMLQNTDALKGYNAEMERALMMDAKEQFQMQMGFLIKKATGANITGPIEQVRKAIEQGALSMKIIGAQFGFDPEVVETMRSLASNMADNSKKLKQAFDTRDQFDSKGIIEILTNTENQQDRASKLTEELKKIQGKGRDLKKIQAILKQQFPTLATDLGKDFGEDNNIVAAALGDILSSLDVNFKSMTDAQKQAAKDEQKRQAKRAGIEAMRQTKNMEDALNNTVSKLLRNIFVTIEKLTSLFSIAFKGQLGNTEKQFDVLSKNSEAIGQFSANVEKQQSDLTYELEVLNEKKDKTPEEKARMEEISKELDFLNKSSNTLQRYQENQEAQRKELETKGKVSANLTNIGDALAAGLSKNKAGLGVTFQTTGAPKPVPLSQTETIATASMMGMAKGGIVPGNNYTGDKVLAGLNSGEMVIPENVWKGAGSGQTVNDNRVINIYVNQNDRRQVEQIVLNALYSDKLK